MGSTPIVGFSTEEMERYARQMVLPGFGPEGQRKLKEGRVLVVGAGGLGSPLLLYLAAAGVGHIGIIDPDVVDQSNLQRQVLYGVDDIGRPKVEAAREKLLSLNPHIEVVAYPAALTTDNALPLIRQYDVVADGTDNFPTRYLVNDACVLSEKVNVYGSVFRYEGQVSVFNLRLADGSRGPNYRDIYPEPPAPGQVPDCAAGGVLGVLPGIVGALQASEVIKVLTGTGDPLSGRLFLFDATSFRAHTLSFGKNPHTNITRLIDYEAFCGMVSTAGNPEEVPFITANELKSLLGKGEDLQLIDVREPFEHQAGHIGGVCIPLSALPHSSAQISRERPVILYCRSGQRSGQALRALQASGFRHLKHLKGGWLAWLDLEKNGGDRDKDERRED